MCDWSLLLYGYTSILAIKTESEFCCFFKFLAQGPLELLPSIGVRRKLSHVNPLIWNHWTKLKQTWQGWYLVVPFPKYVQQPFKMAAVTKYRNFFNCLLLLYHKSKWVQILTAATCQCSVFSVSQFMQIMQIRHILIKYLI
jgi:hypothetical protein